MTEAEWSTFTTFRDQFRAQVARWDTDFAADLRPMQKCFAISNTPPYSLETPIVYNMALENVLPSDDIKLIIVGDNPGKDEQLTINRSYLVGNAGTVGNNFFQSHPELGINFRADEHNRMNVLVLNKTPVHTAQTAQLQNLNQNGCAAVKTILYESQRWMAEMTAELHKALFSSGCDLWLVGYSELKKMHGVFETYREVFGNAYGIPKCIYPSWERVFVFQHFSRSCFTKDLNKHLQQTQTKCPLCDSLRELGTKHRKEIFHY